MSEEQKITVALGGVLDASFGAVLADAKDRVEALRRDSERTFNLQGFVGETRQLQQAYLRLHSIGDAGASATLRSLEGNLVLLRRQGLEVGNLTRLYDRLGDSVRAGELQARGGQQLELAGRRAGELGTFAGALAVPIGMAADYQERVRGLAIRTGIAGTDQERQLSQRIEQSARQSGMQRDDSASLLEAMLDSGMRRQDAQDLLPLAAKFARGQGAGLGDTATLLRSLQVRAGIGDAPGMTRALDSLAYLGQHSELGTVALVRRLPELLAKARPKAGQGLGTVSQLGAMLQVQGREVATADATRAAEGTVDRALAQRNATTGARLDAARQAGEGVLSSIGAAISAEPLFNQALDSGTEVLQQTREVVDEYPRAVAGLVALFAAYKGGRALYGLGRGAIDLARGGLLGLRAGKAGAVLPEIARTGGAPVAGRVGGLPAVLDAAGKDGTRLPRTGRLLLRGAAPIGAGLALLGAAQTYASDDTAEQKGAGYGEAAGALLGTALGATLGSAVPVVGTAIGGAVGGMLGGQIGHWSGTKLGAWLGKDDALSRAPLPVPAAPSAAPVQNWNFAPQITLNVGGGLFEPRQLAEQLLPQLRQLLEDFNTRQRSNSLFDLAVA